MKTKIKKSLSLFVTVTVGFLLISQREAVGESISEGLSICGDVLIVSLFPFMVLSSFALSYGVFGGNGKISSFIMKKFFKLNGNCLPAVIFGFVGGYPVGARVISSLYESGKISRSDARHLFSFCVNAGPAFIVSAVGGMLLGSKEAGYIILFSVCVSSLLTGTVYARIKKKTDSSFKFDVSKKLTLSDALVNAVSSSASGMISVCSWVLVFSAFSSIVSVLTADYINTEFFYSIAEITSGVSYAVKLGGIPFAAACISFGGISVVLQNLPYIKKCGMKISEYLLFRIINGSLTYLISKIILMFADVPVSVYAQYTASIHYAPASASLMIMCAVLIFEILCLF